MVCLVWCSTAKTLITIESVLIKVMSLVIRINALCILIMKVPFLLWLVCIHKVPSLYLILKNGKLFLGNINVLLVVFYWKGIGSKTIPVALYHYITNPN